MHINQRVARTAAVAGATGLAITTWLAFAPPAGATIDNTTGGMTCSGSAVITPKGKSPYTINANQSEAHVPREAGDVQYSGSTNPISHDHSGKVEVKLGPVGVVVYKWGSPNDGNKPSDSGVAKYPSEMKNVPPGKYDVTGFHKAKEGGCSGHMAIIVDGNPLSNPAGAGAAAGTVVTGALLAGAGIARKVAG